MNYIALIASTFLLISSVAEAEGVKAKGAYAGGALGGTQFDDDGLFSGLAFEDNDTSLLLYGGYKFLKYLAVEGRFIGLGSYTFADQFSWVTFNARAFTVNAVGILPFGETRWEMFGQLGLGIINLNMNGGPSEEEPVGSVGIGVRFTPVEHFSVALQADTYAWEDDSFGQSFDLSITTAQVAFQYNF